MVEERNRQGLTQGDLAEMTGFHKAHISNVERRMREPSIDFVEAVGAALGVGRDDVRVIAGIDDPPVSLKPIPDSHTARLNRIRRRAEVEPSSDAEREEVIVLIEAVLDGVARRRRLHASN